MRLVGDRFVVDVDADDAGEIPGLDLVCGGRVTLVVSSPEATADSDGESSRWAARCGRFFRLQHRAFARLVDYGAIGRTSRVEAWRCGPGWSGHASDADRVVAVATTFLRAAALTPGELSSACVHACADGPGVLPASSSGYEVELETSTAGTLALGARGLWRVGRPELSGLAESVIDDSIEVPTAVALWGPVGSGVSTAVNELARVARLHGLLPLSVAVARSAGRDLRRLLEGRSLLLIARDGDPAWPVLVERTCEWPKPHRVLLAGRCEVSRVQGVALARLPAQLLYRAVVPSVTGDLTAERRVAAAAAGSRGLPGRFVDLLWTTSAPAPKRLFARPARAAEHAPAYRNPPPNLVVPTPDAPAPRRWPHGEEVTDWRRRAQDAIGQIAAGRNGPGERQLKAAIGGLSRRAAWLPAAESLVALASHRLRRGQVAGACRALDEASEAARMVTGQLPGCVGHQIGILRGSSLIDIGKLDEATRVLHALMSAARATEDGAALTAVRLPLARSYFWAGRYREADALLSDGRDAELGAALEVQLDVARSRAAVGCGDLERAVSSAAAALEVASRAADPALVARAALGAAFAHMAVGEARAVERDVEMALRAARATRDPLRALKARLVAAESARRRGREPAADLLRRAARLSASGLPATVRARLDLIRVVGSARSGDGLGRRIAGTGLPALVLFVGIPVAQSGTAAAVVGDVLDILRACQTACDEIGAVTSVLALVRERLRAGGVACFAGGPQSTSAFQLVAADGRKPSPDLALRVQRLRQPIAPHGSEGGVEAGAPVCYGGHTVGALTARWPLGSDVDAERAMAILAAAAATVASAVTAVEALRQPRRLHGTHELLGISPAMEDVRRAIERAGPAPFAVLLEGESGSGKELAAHAIHRHSPRRTGSFCTLNCAALPDDLVETELFGHVRGAFTGAVTDRPGVFEQASGGTLFLDEVGELSLRAQAKLLRTVQEGELRRVGENMIRRIDVRLVAATNRDLRQDVTAGRFRLDLLYRLDVIRISLPPLRVRREDVAVLVERFWQQAASRVGSRAVLAVATVGLLAQYDWPGNVRELQNVLAALAVRGPRRGVIPPEALPPSIRPASAEAARRLDAARRVFDERFVRAALVRTGGHRARAACELGLSRQGLTKLMVRLGIASD